MNYIKFSFLIISLLSIISCVDKTSSEIIEDICLDEKTVCVMLRRESCEAEYDKCLSFDLTLDQL